MIIIPMILFFIPLGIKLWIDIRKWKKEQSVNHPGEAVWLIPIEICTAGVGFFVFSDVSPIISIPIVLGLLFFWYWTLFDGFYNILRNKNWWYTGTDDEDDAKTDDFLQQLSLTQHILLKIGGIVAFTLAYILTLQ